MTTIDAAILGKTRFHDAVDEDGQRLAVLLSFSGQGGVERMVMNLVEGFAARGVGVDLVVIRAEGMPGGELPANVHLIDLGVRHSGSAVWPLVRYLRSRRPAALLAAKDRAIRAAVLARAISGVRCRIVGRLGTNLSAALESRSGFARRMRILPIRLMYRWVDHLVCVSKGVREDTLHLARIPLERASVIRNPVVSRRIDELAKSPVDHPWAQDSSIPMIVAAGRLTVQKDFPTLIRAFAALRTRQAARLVILGEGRERARLLQLARDLDVAADVALPGFVSNPYAWMARARLFVLSSAWEGSPNVLTEALALGVPSVATDCPSGPRELLADGRWGPLVPVGDPSALADAMEHVMRSPPSPELLRAAVFEYARDASAVAYLKVLGLDPDRAEHSGSL
ncbi:glycosyltransferase [Rhodocyclaceae bacterium SMB388]